MTAATVLLLGLPPGALVGLDLFTFQLRPDTAGITNIPPGLHFVFVSSEESLSTRNGFWVYVKDADLLVKRWDPQKEELQDGPIGTAESSTSEELPRDHKIVPYEILTKEGQNSHMIEEWQQLTSDISASTLSRIFSPDAGDWKISTTSSAIVDRETIPGLTSSLGKFLEEERQLNFLPIDLRRRVWREGATGRERTDAARDHSWYLTHLTDSHCNGEISEAYGELQFCFLMVLLINNYSCLEQWKRLINLFLTCKSSVVEHQKTYIKLLRQLKLQLRWSASLDSDVFDLEDGGRIFLIKLLRDFRHAIEETSNVTVKGNMLDELDDLDDFLRSEQDWDMETFRMKKKVLDLEDGETVEVNFYSNETDDEDGEFGPAIVDLTPGQLRALRGENVSLSESYSLEELHSPVGKVAINAHGLNDEGILSHRKMGEEEEEQAGGHEDEDEDEQDLDTLDVRF